MPDQEHPMNPSPNRNNGPPDVCTVQLLTAPGRSAVATVAVRGQTAADCISRLFQPLQRDISFCDIGERKICFGHWSGAGSTQGTGEGVVVARTQHDLVEVHCHGGNAAAKQIIDDLVEAGCRRAHAEEQLVPKSCVILQEATEALGQVATERGALILLDQWNGALRNERDQIVQLIQSGDLSQAAARLGSLRSTWRLGEHLTKPWQVVLGGPPNVGKSSLVNALLGFQRAVVFNEPGTTRDVVTARTAIDGWLVELSDTAGLRNTDDAIEKEGVARGQSELLSADCVVLVFDATDDVQSLDLLKSIASQLQAPAIVVLNKTDLCSAEQAQQAAVRVQRLVGQGSGQLIHSSATEGTGIGELLERIGQRLVHPTATESETLAEESLAVGAAILFTARQVNLINDSLVAVADSRTTEAIDFLSQLTTLAG